MTSYCFQQGAGPRLALSWACPSSSAQCHPVLHEEAWTLVTCHSSTTDTGQVQHRRLLPVPPQKQKCKWGRNLNGSWESSCQGSQSCGSWPWAHSPVEHSPKSLELALEAIQLCLCRAASEWSSSPSYQKWVLKEPSGMCAPRTHNPPFLPKAHSWKQAASTQLFSLTHDSSFRYAAS